MVEIRYTRHQAPWWSLRANEYMAKAHPKGDGGDGDGGSSGGGGGGGDGDDGGGDWDDYVSR